MRAPPTVLDARGRLAAEVASLEPWFEQAKRARGGRSATGASGLARAAELDALAAALDNLPVSGASIRMLRDGYANRPVVALRAVACGIAPRGAFVEDAGSGVSAGPHLSDSKEKP